MREQETNTAAGGAGEGEELQSCRPAAWYLPGASKHSHLLPKLRGCKPAGCGQIRGGKNSFGAQMKPVAETPSNKVVFFLKKNEEKDPKLITKPSPCHRHGNPEQVDPVPQ